MSRYLVLTLCFALAGVGCQSGDETYARAMLIESLDQAIGGPKASAREGDFLLENDEIRVVVEQGSPSRLPLGSHTLTCFNLPSRPLRTSSHARRKFLSLRCWLPVCRIRLLPFTTSTSLLPSSMVSVNGFSLYTSLPALSAARFTSVCQ